MPEIALTTIKVIEREHHWAVKSPRIAEHGTAKWNIKHNIPRDGRWKFNGNFECPTFTPSINESWGGLAGDGETVIPNGRDHYIITDGRIQYCSDSTHELAGQTVDLLCFNEAEVEIASK